jgi:hypothetical protein
MHRTLRAGKRAWVVIAASTLLAYAKLLRVVLTERLWRIPQRHVRLVGDLPGRRMS